LKFKFDLNLNLFVIYKTDLKKKKNFLFEIGSWAEIQPAGLAWPALPTLRVAQPLAQHQPNLPLRGLEPSAAQLPCSISNPTVIAPPTGCW
jgi:hypothetical protein